MDIVGSLGYIGQDILFINNDCFAYLTGNAVCLYDISKGPRELIWKTETGISCFATNFESRSMILSPIISKKSLEVVNILDLSLRLTVENPFDVPVINICFSRDGDKIFAITDTTDHKLLLWSINQNNSRLIISKKLDVNYKTCLINPCSSDYVCCYGDSELMIGHVTEVLESYSVKCTCVNLIVDEIYSTEYSSTGSDRNITFVIWIPGNRLLVACSSGAVHEVSCDSKIPPRLLGKFTIPEKRGKTILRPTHAVLSLNNIIIGTKEGLVYWYPLINLMPLASDKEMVIDFNNPLQVSSISKSPISSLAIDPKYQMLLIGTSLGEICRLPVEIQEKEQLVVEGDLDPASSSTAIEQQLKSINKMEKVEAETLIGNENNRDGVILCMNYLSMDILKFSARSKSTLSMFVTGSHLGNIRFWRHNASQIVEAMVIGAGIRRSVPRSLKSLFGLSITDEPTLSTHKSAAVCLVEFVLLPLKHVRLLCVGTDDGYLQVWSMDAQENEDEDAKDPSDTGVNEDGIFCKLLEDDEGGCNVRLEIRKIFQTKFYDGVVSMLTFMPITLKNTYHLKAAVASECDKNIYIINFLLNDSVVLNNGVETYISLDNSEVPRSMIWNNDQLFIFNDYGSVYIYNVQEKANLVIKAKALPSIVSGSLSAGIVDIVVLLNNSSLIHTCNINELKYNDASKDIFKGFKHDDTVVCLAQAPSGKYFATGCVDGFIYVWKMKDEDGNIILANKIKLHASSVSSLSFSSDSSLLFSCGIDGSCFIATLDKPTLTEKASLRGNYAKGEEPQYISEIIPDSRITLKQSSEGGSGEQQMLLTWIETKKIEEAKEQKSKHKFKALGISGAINEIAQRLNVLVQQNSERNELEILDRSEFVIDVKRIDSTLNSNKIKAKHLQDIYKQKNYCNELLAARLRTKCWDNLEIKPNNLFSFLASKHKNFSVSSMPIQKYSTEQILLMQKVKRLRAIEIRSQKIEDLGITSHIHGTPYYRCAWSTSLSGCPSSVSWISNDGTRWPISDKIAMLLTNEKVTNKADNGSSGKDNSKVVVTANEEDEGSLASDEEIHDIDESNILNLIYPPQAVRTQVQRRTQIILLREIIRQMRLKFNEQFDNLRREKEDIISSIESRNVRMQAILEDLHQEEDLFAPNMSDKEIAGSAIHVKLNELLNRPYESEVARISRLKEEEEKRLLELQKDKEDIKGRALDEMMHGTLEVKRDVLASAASTLAKPEWMDTLTPHEMNESQLKEYDIYQTNLKAIQEEQANYRKTLELEMKKLKLEVNDLCKSFDDKLEDLSNLKVLVLREILSQEIYVSRLSLNMAKAEQAMKFMTKSEEQILVLRADRADLKCTIDKLSVQLEEMKGKINSIQEEERQMDKTFRRDLQNLCNNTFDQNSLKILTQLYRQRTYPAGGYDGGGDEMDDQSEIDVSQSAAKSNNRSKSMGTTKRSNNKSQSKRGGLSGSHSDANKGKKLKASKGVNASGSNVTGKDASLGPMQLAAQALKSAETEETGYKEKDPYYEALLAEERKRLIQDASIPIMSQLSLESDCPEGFDIDQFSWSKLQELRTARIEKEIEGKFLSIEFSKLKQKLEHFDNEDAILASCINDIKYNRDLSLNVLKELDSNLEITVRLLQGQDEVDRDAVVTDYSDALLVPTTVVGKFNTRIKELGKEKIGVLSKIKLFRRKINLIDWEAKHHGLEARHYEAYLTDLQLFRVTRELQKIIREGKDSQQAKEKLDKLAQRKDYLNQDADAKLSGLRKTLETLQRQLEDRNNECYQLEGKISNLKSQVSLSKSVKQSRDESRVGGQPGGIAAIKMKKVVAKRHMVDTARAQAEEIDYLRQELDKLRQRTFPSFVKATRKRLATVTNENY